MQKFKEIMAVIRPQNFQVTREVLFNKGIDFLLEIEALGRGRERGVSDKKYLIEGASSGVPFLRKRVISFLCPPQKVKECLSALVEANQTGKIGDGKIFVMPVTLPLTPSPRGKGVGEGAC